MSDEGKRPQWAVDRPGVELDATERAVEEQLALVDRVIGLEQQLNELRGAGHLSPSSVLAEERNLALIRNSTTWKVGRTVMLPVRVVRVLKRRLLG